jgi:hypothetical protein
MAKTCAQPRCRRHQPGSPASWLSCSLFGEPPNTICGEWDITNTIQQTTHSNSNGLSFGYRVILTENGTRFEGSGEKRIKNGHELPSSARTRIIISGGSVRGEEVTRMFTERGTDRSTSGEFTRKM